VGQRGKALQNQKIEGYYEVRSEKIPLERKNLFGEKYRARKGR
jgi:hypothetical protein